METYKRFKISVYPSMPLDSIPDTITPEESLSETTPGERVELDLNELEQAIQNLPEVAPYLRIQTGQRGAELWEQAIRSAVWTQERPQFIMGVDPISEDSESRGSNMLTEATVILSEEELEQDRRRQTPTRRNRRNSGRRQAATQAIQELGRILDSTPEESEEDLIARLDELSQTE